MDKKLEARIARLERIMNHKSVKNEDIDSISHPKKDITLREFLGDLYDDLIVLTNNDKQRVLNILEHYADKSGFFERIKEHVEYLESENKEI